MPRKLTPEDQARRQANERLADETRDTRRQLGIDPGYDTQQAVHHYRKDHRIDELVKLRSRPAEGPDIGFMNRVLTVCALPRRSQPNVRNFVRRAGPYTLHLTAMNSEFGLPYGTYPRLLFAWICTEVVRTQSPHLKLGRSFSEFMKKLGVYSSNSGGRWGVRTRLRDQIGRLFCCAILMTYETEQRTRYKGQLIVEEADLWWDPLNPDARSLWESTIEVGHKLFLEILAHPVPLDLRILKAMKRSPLGIDLFLWLSYRTFRLTGASRISWKRLYEQFGSQSGPPTQGALKGFRNKVIKELDLLRTAWPELRIERVRTGLVLRPSMPRVRPREEA